MFDIHQEKNLLNVSAVGKLTVEDYKKLTPVVDRALHDHGRIKLFIDLKNFQGWEWAAAWEDIKLGMKHRKEFSKVAIVGNKKWEEWLSKMGALMMPGEVKYFDEKETQQGLTWINQ